MTITRRAVVGAFAAGALASGLVGMPASAMLVPPEPEVVVSPDSLPSPAMTAGRAWCACNDLAYTALWID